jgi:hypothetical protein
MRFDRRKVKATPTAAVLRLYISSRSGGRVRVNAVAPAQRWSEKRTTFKNTPAIGDHTRAGPARHRRHEADQARATLRSGGERRATSRRGEQRERASAPTDREAPRGRAVPAAGPPVPAAGPPVPAALRSAAVWRSGARGRRHGRRQDQRAHDPDLHVALDLIPGCRTMRWLHGCRPDFSLRVPPLPRKIPRPPPRSHRARRLLRIRSCRKRPLARNRRGRSHSSEPSQPPRWPSVSPHSSSRTSGSGNGPCLPSAEAGW